VVFPLEDGFMTVGAPPAPGSWETGKDAHVIRGPWRISGDQLVFDDDRGRFILHPPELREHIARAEGSAGAIPRSSPSGGAMRFSGSPSWKARSGVHRRETEWAGRATT
jgi:hypothetical protein